MFSSNESIAWPSNADQNDNDFAGFPDAARTNSRFASFLATRITHSPKASAESVQQFRVKMADILVLIPARMASARLPGKPLADIAGHPMIVHVMRRAQAARIGPVLIATDSEAIVSCVEKAGGRAILTRADHQSGSDRIFEALHAADAEDSAQIILNVQGDLPTLAPADLASAVVPLRDAGVDIGTLAAEITRPEECLDPNVVKVVGTPVGRSRLRALYFTRATAPSGPGPLYHHIGIYAYRRESLARFVSLPPSPLERRENLEQLRALEAGMRIDVTIVNSAPLGVDTPAELERARQMLAPQQH